MAHFVGGSQASPSEPDQYGSPDISSVHSISRLRDAGHHNRAPPI